MIVVRRLLTSIATRDVVVVRIRASSAYVARPRRILVPHHLHLHLDVR